jgi:hypothetical protein
VMTDPCHERLCKNHREHERGFSPWALFPKPYPMQQRWNGIDRRSIKATTKISSQNGATIAGAVQF